MNQRPINLELTSLQYPPMAIASILHRISGVILFVLLPMMLYFLARSLKSESSFAELQLILGSPLPKLLLWGFLSAGLYHLLAGIRHIFLDMGWGESVPAARNSALLVILLAVPGIIGLGIWLWNII